MELYVHILDYYYRWWGKTIISDDNSFGAFFIKQLDENVNNEIKDILHSYKWTFDKSDSLHLIILWNEVQVIFAIFVMNGLFLLFWSLQCAWIIWKYDDEKIQMRFHDDLLRKTKWQLKSTLIMIKISLFRCLTNTHEEK